MAAEARAHCRMGLGCGSEEIQVSCFTACPFNGRWGTPFSSSGFLWPGTAGSPGLPELPCALDVQRCPRQLGGAGGCWRWCWPFPSLCTPVRLWIQTAALQVGVGCKGSSRGLLSELLLQAGFTLALEQAAQGCLRGSCASPRREDSPPLWVAGITPVVPACL